MKALLKRQSTNKEVKTVSKEKSGERERRNENEDEVLVKQ